MYRYRYTAYNSPKCIMLGYVFVYDGSWFMVANNGYHINHDYSYWFCGRLCYIYICKNMTMYVS